MVCGCQGVEAIPRMTPDSVMFVHQLRGAQRSNAVVVYKHNALMSSGIGIDFIL
jgi:hypothetical protein